MGFSSRHPCLRVNNSTLVNLLKSLQGLKMNLLTMLVIIYVYLLAQREGCGVWQTCFLDRKVVIVASNRNVAFFLWEKNNNSIKEWRDLKTLAYGKRRETENVQSHNSHHDWKMPFACQKCARQPGLFTGITIILKPSFYAISCKHLLAWIVPSKPDLLSHWSWRK